MDIPRNWRLNKERIEFHGIECPHCSAKMFVSRDICNECGRPTTIEQLRSGKIITKGNKEQETTYSKGDDIRILMKDGKTITANLDGRGDYVVRHGSEVEVLNIYPNLNGNERIGRLDMSYKSIAHPCQNTTN